MLSVLKARAKCKKHNNKKVEELCKPKHIFVKKVYFEEKQLKNGNTLIEKKEKLIDLTKIVNEHKKAIKTETVLQKLAKTQDELLNKGVL